MTNRVFAVMLCSSLAVFVSPAHGQCNVRENIIYGDPVYSKIYVTVKVPDGRCISVPVVNGILPGIDEQVDDYDRVTRTYTYTSGVRYAGGSMPTYSPRKKPAPSTKESYEREERPAPRVMETRAVVIEEDGDHPRYGGERDLGELRRDIQRLKDRLDRDGKEEKTSPIPKSRELDEAKQAILELREEVKKLQLLTLKYETEKKQAAAPSGMVRPSELGKKKE